MDASRSTHLIAVGGRSFVSWLTGTGFLMLHGALFFLSLSILIPWNLYSDPGDFWVADPLRKWAFLLAFHALLVGAWSVAQHLILSDDDDSTDSFPMAPSWGRSNSKSSPAATSEIFRGASQPTASSLLAEEWARRWLESDSDEQSGSPPTHESVPAAAYSQFPATPRGNQNGKVRQRWPDAPDPHQARTSRLNDRVKSDHLSKPATEHGSSKNEVDPLRTTAGSSSSSEFDHEDELDGDWRWIEAAANAWLSRREQELSQNGKHEGSS